ncbi:MAG: LysR substrate-binding domain-containing protein [Pseudomonadota bacterium]
MKPDLPPLAATRVFDAAARNGSFTAAALELGMTQSAVSYQIRLLEDRVGSALFIRNARGVSLNPLGQRFHHRVSAAFDMLSGGYADAKGEKHNTLNLSVIPTFATNFLAQHLGAFSLEEPEIAVRMEVSDLLTNFTRDQIDVAIRGGNGKWENMVSRRLMPTVFSPMVSPALAQSVGGLSKPADLLKLHLISPENPWWRLWFAAHDVQVRFDETSANRNYGPQVVEAGAAVSGHGVAILTPAFFQNELERGDLIQPFETLGDDSTGFWLVYPESRRNASKVRKFRSWIEQATEPFRQT